MRGWIYRRINGSWGAMGRRGTLQARSGLVRYGGAGAMRSGCDCQARGRRDMWKEFQRGNADKRGVRRWKAW